MGRIRKGLFLGLCVSGACIAFAATNCAAPTQIRVDVRVSPPSLCNKTPSAGHVFVQNTGIAVTTRDHIDDADLTIFEGGGCFDPPGDQIGILTITPSGSKDAEVAIRIVSGVKVKATECTPPDYKDCIVARRFVSFIPNETVPITVVMGQKCLDKVCDKSQECNPDTGECVDRAQVQQDGAVAPIVEAGDETPIVVNPTDTGTDSPVEPVDAGFDACANCLGDCKNGHDCTVLCDNTHDCTNKNVCGAGIQTCKIDCTGNATCTGTTCNNGGPLGTCDFHCHSAAGGTEPRCTGVACSAGTCTMTCEDQIRACKDVFLDGGTNMVTCNTVADNPSCDDVNCTSVGGTCRRTCGNADAGGCGLAGACTPIASCAAWADGGNQNP